MKQNYIYSFLFFFISLGCFAQLPDFTLAVTATPETCSGNGTLAFTTSGTNPDATIVFSIYLLPNITDPISTTPSNSLSGLDAGTYRVIATQTLGNLSNSQQQDIVIQQQVTPLDFYLTGTDAICGNNGTITAHVVSGSPATFEIFSGPITTPPQTSILFENLVPGTYTIRTIDACGQGYVKVFTILSPELSTTAFTITENEFPTVWASELVACNQIKVGHRINVDGNNYIAFPLTFVFTVYPPNGTSAIISSHTVSGVSGIYNGIFPIPISNLPFGFVIPYFDSPYNYDLEVTDACGNPYYRQNNIIDKKFRFNAGETTASCGGKNLQIIPQYYRLPITVEFLDAPAGFDPASYGNTHPTFTATPLLYQSPGGVPEGNYTIRITDGCGRVSTVSKTITNGTSPFASTGYINCEATTSIFIPGAPMASVSIIQAPAGFGQELPFDVSSYITETGSIYLSGILVVGNYLLSINDICGNNYIYPFSIEPPVHFEMQAFYLGGCGQNQGSVRLKIPFTSLTGVTFISGPASYLPGFPHDVSSNIIGGEFHMNSLPSGIYQVSTVDQCGFLRNKTLFIGGYFGSTEIEVFPNCTTFDFFLNHTNNITPENIVYWIQKKNEVTGIWGHPTLGGNYAEGSIPNNTNAKLVSNNMVNTNIGNNGEYRIIAVSDIYSNGAFQLEKCLINIHVFTVESTFAIENTLNFSCLGNLSDVLLEVTGSGPFNFRIIEKDGQPFEVENGENPLFTNLEIGVYRIQIEDSCGNLTVLVHDVSVPFIFGITSFLCEGQNSTLSVPNFSYLEYEWFKEGTENTILSTSATLNINSLSLATDSGTYYVSISYPANEESCLNQMLSYTISAGNVPNSGNDDEVTLCTLPLTINLNDYLSGDYDENGTWEQINPGGTLTSNVWNVEGITNGIYSFKYIVNGFCGVTDEAIIAIEVLVDMPNPEIAAINPICSGETIDLSITNPDSNYSYSWTGPNNFISNEQNPSIQNATVAMSGTYTVTATRGNCQTVGSIEVVVNSLPDFYFANENIVICPGQNAEIEIRPTSTATIPYQFVWYFNNVEITGENTTTLEINAPGTYSVVITYGDCSITKTIEVTQNTNLFEVGITAHCEDNHYMLSAFAINNSFNESTATYLWSGPNGFYGTTQFMDITGLESRIYSVSITNESGCSVTASIEIQKSSCRIPKGVSPNGDGQNDTWDLSGFDILKVKIFNRYGLEIYDINNYVDQWHGQSHNGKLLPTSTYYYYIQFRNGEETTGWVYLNREE